MYFATKRRQTQILVWLVWAVAGLVFLALPGQAMVVDGPALNMLALLAYSLLERQARQGGLQMTTRRIIHKLESLDVVETQCRDGSHLLRLVPIDEELVDLL